MCQLFGLCSNDEVNIKFSFEEWKWRGISNPHGYGFAYRIGDKWDIKKKPISLFKDREEIRSEIVSIRSRIFVNHVRLKSAGDIDGSNTHPFEYGGYVFAHNGTVCDYENYELKLLKPEGKTDSEHMFLWLMEQLRDVPENDFAKSLKDLSCRILNNNSKRRFNFLLSDGNTLWGFADDRLHYIERKPPYKGTQVSLISEIGDNGEEFHRIELAEVKSPNEKAVLIATEPLTNENWVKLKKGELLEVKDGEVVRIL